MKFIVFHPLSPTLSPVVNKGITVFFGGTEELLEVQGEAPIFLIFISEVFFLHLKVLRLYAKHFQISLLILPFYHCLSKKKNPLSLELPHHPHPTHCISPFSYPSTPPPTRPDVE